MSMAAGHRLRWGLVWVLVGAWFVGLAVNIGGDRIHVLLLVAIAILVYELLVEDVRGPTSSG